MATTEQKAAWRKANPERCKVTAALYRAKKKGVEPPPEILALAAKLDAEKEAKKAETRARVKEARKAYRDSYKERKKARYKERYYSDPEFREKQLAKRRRQYQRKAAERGDTDRETTLRRRRENMAKALRARNAQQHAQAAARAAEREAAQAQKNEAEQTLRAIQQMKRKPGRLAALNGWR